jgi:hypothetical protein
MKGIVLVFNIWDPTTHTMQAVFRQKQSRKSGKVKKK